MSDRAEPAVTALSLGLTGDAQAALAGGDR
jgi:hypothetical protein